jgi:anti-sigma factor RsiW
MLPEQFTCQEFVELVTDYLEQALPADLRAQCDAHRAECIHCEAYLEQMRQTIRALGALIHASTSPAAQAELLAAFRSWKHSR